MSNESKMYTQIQPEEPDKRIDDALRAALTFTQEARTLLWRTLVHLETGEGAASDYLAKDIRRLIAAAPDLGPLSISDKGRATDGISLSESIWRSGGGSGEFHQQLGILLGHIKQETNVPLSNRPYDDAIEETALKVPAHADPPVIINGPNGEKLVKTGQVRCPNKGEWLLWGNGEPRIASGDYNHKRDILRLATAEEIQRARKGDGTDEIQKMLANNKRPGTRHASEHVWSIACHAPPKCKRKARDQKILNSDDINK